MACPPRGPPSWPRRTKSAADSACPFSLKSGCDAGRRLIVRCRVPQLPDLRGAKLVDRLGDQIRGLEVVGGVEVRPYVVHDLREAAPACHLVADRVPVAQRS